MGFLDFFDDANAMKSLLGIGSPPDPLRMQAAAGGVPIGQPMSPPQMNATMDMVPQPGPMTMAQLQPGQDGSMGRTMSPPMINMPPSANNSAPPLPPPINVGGGPNAPSEFDQRWAPAAARPLTDAGPMAQVNPLTSGGGVAPMTQMGPATPAPMPPTSAMNEAPLPTNTGGTGLRGLFGLDQDQWRAKLSGLGKGLTAVGSLPRGAPAGQAFAAGAGGTLTGTSEAEQKQEALKRQAQNDLFNQSSTAWKDWILGEKLGDEKIITASRAKYYDAQAALAPSKGQQNMYHAESLVLKWSADYRKIQEARQKATGQPVDEAEIEKRTEQHRKQIYKSFGIDPSKAEDELNRGTNKTNPFDASRMTEAAFHKQVQPGAWFDTGKKYGPDGTFTSKDRDGNPRILRGKPGDSVILRRSEQSQTDNAPAGQIPPMPVPPGARSPTQVDQLDQNVMAE